MKCMRCGDERVTETTGTHRYDESGLEHVLLGNVKIRVCEGCGARAVVIPAIEQLHAALASSIARKQEKLTAHEARFLRTQLGFCTEDLASVLGVAPEDVRAWEDKDAGNAMPEPAELRLRMMAMAPVPLQDYRPETIGRAARMAPAPAKISFTRCEVERRHQSSPPRLWAPSEDVCPVSH